MTLSTMDKAIQEAFPLVAMPRHSELEATENYGMRYIVGSNGIHREVTLPWVRMVHRMESVGLRNHLPYGEVKPLIELAFTAIPAEMFAQIRAAARQAHPNEVAGALIWNEVSGQWRHELRQSTSVGAAHVDYKEVTLGRDEHLVVDWHSHGDFDAGFSVIDNNDDLGAMRFSLVIGKVMGGMNVAMRLCMAGVYFDADLTQDGRVVVTL